MLGRTHQIIGLTASTGWYLSTANPSYGPATLAGVVIASVIGSLIPDLDRPTAEIWKKIPYGKIFGKVVDPIISHRSFSHSILGLVMFGWLIHYILMSFPAYWGINANDVFIAFLIGYISHLVADMVTDKGIPLFFPYPKFIGIPPKPFEGMRIITGKWFENLVLFPLFNIIFVVIIITHYNEIKVILFK